MKHWSTKYIGLPYKPGARGPKEVDCWGLLRMIYRDEMGLLLPEYPGVSLETPDASRVIQSEVQSNWIETQGPFEGCAVGMSEKKDIHHVGVFTEADRGKVIHCWKSKFVVADTIRCILMSGMRTMRYFRHIQWRI